MKRISLALAAVVAGALAIAAPAVRAAAPVATIAQLTGQVMVLKPDGRPRILATASRVHVGDTLVSEEGSYVRLVLDDGNQVVLGPRTSLKMARADAQETALALAGGQVQVTGTRQAAPGHQLKLHAGATTIAAGAASFTLAYIPPPDTAKARRQDYLRSSLAALPAGLAGHDGGADLPLRQVIAQGLVPPRPLPGTSRGLGAPGLHVQVLDGSIMLSNPAGSALFHAGQFGFVQGAMRPPVLVPAAGVPTFTPPPTFALRGAGAGQGGAGPVQQTVDCEVR